MLVTEEDEKLNLKDKKIVVIGTGYVGLPAAILFARVGCKVVGVDIDKNIVEAINDGVLHIGEKELEKIFQEENVRKNLKSQETPCEGDCFLIAVPTPLDKRKKIADLSFVIAALKSILPYLRKGNLIILESTVPPLTCREIIKPIIEQGTSLHVNRDVYVAHCPERILPGNIFHEIVHNDRVIGGMNEKASQIAKELYSSFVKGHLFITDDVTAELCKLAENTFRDVNIALANEIEQVSETLGVDAQEVIKLANNHPRVKLLHPGIGVGGHCIPLDPWFIKEIDPENTSLIFAARRVNDARPKRIAGKIRRLLKDVSDPNIVVLGIAYKPNTYDKRESPALEIIDILKADGYDVACYDPFVKNYEYTTIADVVKGKDCLAVLVEHNQIKEELEENLDRIKKQMRTPIVFRPTHASRRVSEPESIVAEVTEISYSE
jgi:UDP-N-acetyl-D-mannosaminuronic acid dehydrogenase